MKSPWEIYVSSHAGNHMFDVASLSGCGRTPYQAARRLEHDLAIKKIDQDSYETRKYALSVITQMWKDILAAGFVDFSDTSEWVSLGCGAYRRANHIEPDAEELKGVPHDAA